MKELIYLRNQVEEFFESKQYKESCRKRYRQTWNRLADFMATNKKVYYTPQIGKDFLLEWHNGKNYNELTDRQKERYRHIYVLSDLIIYGRVRRCVRQNKIYEFKGELGIHFNQFIEFHRNDRTPFSLRRYEERIFTLYEFLLSRNKTLGNLTTPLVIQFVKKLDDVKTPCSRDNTIMTLRVFFRFLCEHKVLPENIPEKWISLLKFKKVHGKKIPSIYTKEEVDAILNAIDRANPQGKRDYAMALLAARYGLRVSDIIGLRFRNIIWDENKIVIVQQKTKKKVTLPLSEEVGTAIIDYLKNGRPNIDLPYVFITVMAPYRELSSNILCANISEWMRSAGINSTGKKRGPHALRHSLATNLLATNNPIPVISKILGHTTTESTTTYTKVSIDMLRQCALDVPFIPSTIYEDIYD